MKPSPEVEAVKVAHVPVVYHVPPEMMQPFVLPEVTTFRYPLPLKEPLVGVEVGPVLVEVETVLVEVETVLVEVGPVLVEVAVEVGELPPPPDFGKYLIPVLGQEEVLPTASVGTNVPV